MLSRKNKDLRTIKEGVVGKYIKKDTPPEIPIINVWTTEPNRRARRRNNNTNQSSMPSTSMAMGQQPSMVQKFGNIKTTTSAVGLGSHEGKYTPNSSVPNLAQRFASLLVKPDCVIDERHESHALLPVHTVDTTNHIYANQYAGSEYHLDRVQSSQIPFMQFNNDAEYENLDHAVLRQQTADYSKSNSGRSSSQCELPSAPPELPLPPEKEGLPTGWEKIESTEHGAYYVNHITRQAQFDHPCYPFETQKGVIEEPPRHTHFHSHSVLVPANPYLTEEIPHWLNVYSRASVSLDRKLRWELFRLPELDCFSSMLTRLYKQELEEVVMRYEEYRSALLCEMEQRLRELNPANCSSFTGAVALRRSLP
ncbi:scaffold protein salvador-like isoform X2 [Aphidius gifuensis]|uniref:scaffold protein salvador-like isoform X2 n=1 Tax=Aphidius gifuensis TaxID=684658 RepID=UPI001CDB809E|nr:scaffold protein salvador-like isoform X2 [Aphidius gifuensis]